MAEANGPGSSSSESSSSTSLLGSLWGSTNNQPQTNDSNNTVSSNITFSENTPIFSESSSLKNHNQKDPTFDTSNAGLINERVRQWTIEKRRQRDGKPLIMTEHSSSEEEFLTQGLGSSLLDEYTSHCGLRWYERLYDECSYRFNEAVYPMRNWRWRHFVGLYILQRFFMRPVLYAPGILAFYHLQIGRRITPIVKTRLREKSLIKLMGPAFWDSGYMQGWMRLPFRSQRYREACADFTVFLSFSWPIWYWVRVYYGYYIIEWMRWRVDLDPTLSMQQWNIAPTQIGSVNSQTLTALTQ